MQEKDTDLYSRSVWKLIRRRSRGILGPETEEEGGYQPSTDTMRYIRERADEMGLTRAIIRTYPGSAKSWSATTLVNRAWEEKGLKGLYLMLSHHSIKERLERLRGDGKDQAWAHWRPHAGDCDRDVFNKLGYIGQGDCTCGRGELKAEGPTLAPLDHVLPSLPNHSSPRLGAVSDFDFWVIDELDLSPNPPKDGLGDSP